MEYEELVALQNDFHAVAKEALKATSNEIFGDLSKNLGFITLSKYPNGEKMIVKASTNLNDQDGLVLMTTLLVMMCQQIGIKVEKMQNLMAEIYSELEKN